MSIGAKEPAPLNQVVRGRIGYGEPAFPAPAPAFLWVTSEQFLIALVWVPDVVLTCPFRSIRNVALTGDEGHCNVVVTRRGFMGSVAPDPSNPDNTSYYWIGFGPNARLRAALVEAIQKVAPPGALVPSDADALIPPVDMIDHTPETFDQLRNHLDLREHVELMDWPTVVERLLREHELGLAERAGIAEPQARAERATAVSDTVVEQIGRATLVSTFEICHWAMEGEDMSAVFESALMNSGYNQARNRLFPETNRPTTPEG